MTTQVNIRLLIEKLKSVKAKDGECTLLIDFKSAYNTVNRQRLYEIMLKKNILPPEEIEFLKILHDNLYFVGKDKRRVFLQNGVHQGSPISPALFNIYIEEVMARIREDLIDRNMWYKLYADDLVIIIKHRDIHDLLRSLRHLSADFSLNINEKKSGIFLNQKRLSPEESFIDGFPVIGSYPYLGVALNYKGNLKPQMTVIKRRADYLIRAMKYVAK